MATEFITRKKLAERWDCTPECVKKYERRGKLHPVKLGERLLRYRLAEVEKLERDSTIDRQEVKA